MTQEEKQLLLKDLCERLLYEPIVTFVDKKGNVSDRIDVLNGFGFSDRKFPYFSTELGFVLSTDEIRPYLRPMSSMTEEEEDYYFSCIDEMTFTMIYQHKALELLDWLNEHHFDYQGLIEKGLALEAPEDMYEEKKN